MPAGKFSTPLLGECTCSRFQTCLTGPNHVIGPVDGPNPLMQAPNYHEAGLNHGDGPNHGRNSLDYVDSLNREAGLNHEDGPNHEQAPIMWMVPTMSRAQPCK
jgi:hypothetical protein